MIGLSYKTKKELKENIGKRLKYVETSLYGDEFKENGSLTGVGPSPYERKWYATVTIKDGLIEKVK